jgi:hypothetical protein
MAESSNPTLLHNRLQQLMAQREDLKMESGARPNDTAEHCKPGNQGGRHRETEPNLAVYRRRQPRAKGPKTISRKVCPANSVSI